MSDSMRVRRAGQNDALLIESNPVSGPNMSCTSSRALKRRKCRNASIIFLLVLLLGSFVWLLYLLSESPFHFYDSRPLSDPQYLSNGSVIHKIAVVTDLDHDSALKDKGKWISYLKKGQIMLSPDRRHAVVSWNDNRDITLSTAIAAGGRAMELSDLVVFNRHLLTVDDRTGLLYQLDNDTAIPWVFLDDGPGTSEKPMKGEWLTVKDGELVAGGLGKEWSSRSGEFINDHPMWIKIVDTMGRVRHLSWTENFRKLRREVGLKPEGYLIHEAVQWSPVHKQWFFLPRRACNEQYDDVKDEHKGTNMLITADANFNDIQMVRIGKGVYEGTKGFSAFQFIPGTGDTLILALKSEEIDGKPVATYVTVFDIYGEVLMEDSQLKGSFKFEGLAFV